MFRPELLRLEFGELHRSLIRSRRLGRAEGDIVEVIE